MQSMPAIRTSCNEKLSIFKFSSGGASSKFSQATLNNSYQEISQISTSGFAICDMLPRLRNSVWLATAAKCLADATDVATQMRQATSSLVTYDPLYDYHFAVMALVHVFVDSYFRTILGLKVLIEKVWYILLFFVLLEWSSFFHFCQKN